MAHPPGGPTAYLHHFTQCDANRVAARRPRRARQRPVVSDFVAPADLKTVADDRGGTRSSLWVHWLIGGVRWKRRRRRIDGLLRQIGIGQERLRRIIGNGTLGHVRIGNDGWWRRITHDAAVPASRRPVSDPRAASAGQFVRHPAVRQPGRPTRSASAVTSAQPRERSSRPLPPRVGQRQARRDRS
jgi:hypothetical protein